jgi:hypothetical protein
MAKPAKAFQNSLIKEFKEMKSAAIIKMIGVTG